MSVERVRKRAGTRVCGDVTHWRACADSTHISASMRGYEAQQPVVHVSGKHIANFGGCWRAFSAGSYSQGRQILTLRHILWHCISMQKILFSIGIGQMEMSVESFLEKRGRLSLKGQRRRRRSLLSLTSVIQVHSWAASLFQSELECIMWHD